MDKLSFELVEHIASFLDLDDAISLSATGRVGLEACRSRVDPEKYLQTTFRYPRYLLAAMTDYGCIISGSRALEYFIPGSIIPAPAGGYNADTPPSDWDFLAPCSYRSSTGMMDALEKCGVEWENPMAEVFALVDKPAGSVAFFNSTSIFFAKPSQLKNISREGPSSQLVELYQQLYAFVNGRNLYDVGIKVEVLPKPDLSLGELASRPRYKVTQVPLENINQNGSAPAAAPVDGQDDTESDYGDMSLEKPIRMINGYIRPPSKSSAGGYRQKVQLFQCHRRQLQACTPLEYVVNTYYATHVQCFISGWSAGHFYYDLTRQRLALVWPIEKNKAHHTSVKKCVRKYRTRGYRFFDASRPDVEFDDDLQRLRRDQELVVDPMAEFRDIVYQFNNTCINDTVRGKFMAAIGPAIVNMSMARTMEEGDAAVAAAISAATVASNLLLSSPAVDNVHATRVSDSLSPEAYDEMREAAKPMVGHLGMKGTLLIRFHHLHDGIWKLCASENNSHTSESRIFKSVPGPSEWRTSMALYDKFFFEFIDKFRFSVPFGKRLTALEPKLQSELRGRYPSNTTSDDPVESSNLMPSLCDIMIQATASGKIEGNRAAPPKAVVEATAGIDSSKSEVTRREDMWRYFQLLLLFTPNACSGVKPRDCALYNQDFIPPQI